MKKALLYFMLLGLILPLSSCREEKHSVALGTVEYTPAFWWSAADTVMLTKTFVCDFSDDAKSDPTAFAEFSFVRNDGETLVPTSEMEIYINGEKLAQNKVRVSSGEAEKVVTISFSPDAEDGKYQGYLKLSSSNLDKVDNFLLEEDAHPQLLQWTIYYEKNWNPLKTIVVWIVGIIVAFLLLWFCAIRPIMYPWFGPFTKSVLISQNGRVVRNFNVRFKGARKVVFASQKVKQSFGSRIFTGEIRTYIITTPTLRESLTFTPRKKNALAYGMGYSIQPNPVPKYGVATIKFNQDNIEIKLT